LGKWKLYTFVDIIDRYHEERDAENFALRNTIFDCKGRGGYILDSDHERSVVKEAL